MAVAPLLRRLYQKARQPFFMLNSIAKSAI